MADCKESDWKMFRTKIVTWQEKYMAKKAAKQKRIK